MGVRKEKAFRVPYAYPQAFDIACASLVNIGAVVQQVNPMVGQIIATMGASLQSFGEVIGVQLRGVDPWQTDIHVESTSAVPTTVFDWGKNQENLNAFEVMFAQVAAQLPSAVAPPVQPANPPAAPDYDPFADEFRNAALSAPQEPSPQSAAPTATTPQSESTGHRVFISYRRSDSIDICGRMYDRLVRDFGDDNVFKDVDNIPFGVDFVDYLDNQVKKCTVLLAVIGQQWVSASDDKGRRRLDDPNDFVRIEIESALKRNILVVPVLVGGAEMPYAEDLPETLRPLTRRNGISIRPDPDFHNDMSRLVKRLG